MFILFNLGMVLLIIVFAAANGLFTEQSLDLVDYCMWLMGWLLHVFVGFAIDPADIVACSFSAVGFNLLSFRSIFYFSTI